MNDDEVISALRAAAGQKTACQMAELLGTWLDGGLTQGAIVTYFKRAFPAIPLRVLLQAEVWTRVNAGGMTDAEFDALLGPWLVNH